MNTPTPKTDTLFNEIEPEFCDMSAWDYFCEMTALATEHETKLSAVTKQRNELKNKLEKSKSYKNVMKRDNAELRKQLTAVTIERDEFHVKIEELAIKLSAVTEQRDEAREQAVWYRHLFYKCEAPFYLFSWETNQPEHSH